MIPALAKSSGCISQIVFSVPTGFSLALPIHYSCQWLRFSYSHSHWWPSNIGWKTKEQEERQERIKWGEREIPKENRVKGGGDAWQRGGSVDDGMWR